MSSGIETPPLPPAPDAGKPPIPPPTPSERLIEERLRQTRRQVKGVDIITGLMTLLVCGSIYLFAAALADHWLFTGGLGFWGRLVLWTILLAAGGVYFVLKVWPAIVYRINPIYAAETIEKSKPSLKNSLINFLLLRGHDREVAPVVYRAMEQRAAADLNQIEIDLAVDRHGILRWLYILLAVFVIFCLYLFISPKNPLVSAGRVLWPWANVQPPTRVTIDDSVSPGDATKFNGDTMTVSAEVHGLKEGEPVLLHYSTADKQILDQTLPLTLEKGKYRHEGQLPPGNMGFQQDCTYYLSAGDCRTREFNVAVKIPPTIVVDRLDYHYPKYTGLPDRSVSRQGNISAIEGTTVDVVAVANMPIQRANLDLNCLNRSTSQMDVKDMTATGHITLKLNADGSMKPEYASYQVIFTDMDRRANSRPIQHRIDVTPDQRPDVKILEPEPEKVSIAADGKLEISVQASDPDFALRRVAIAAECDGRKLDLVPILDLKAPTPPKTGQFEGQYVFEPSKLGLKGGERVEYWAEADDNKEPTANRSTTAKKLIEILSPENRPQNDRQPRLADKNSRPGGKGDKNEKKNDRDNRPPENRPNDENNPQKDDNKDAAQNNPEQKQQEKGPRNKEDRAKQDEPSQANDENRPDQPPEGDQGDASQKLGGEGNANDGNQKGGKQDDQPEKNVQPPEQENRKINPDAQEGDAFQKILDDANKQKKPNQPDQEDKQNADRPENKNQNDQQASGDESKNGDNQTGKNNSGEKNKSGEKNSGEKNAQQNPSEKNDAGEKPSGEKDSGEKNAEQKGNGKNDKNVEKSDQQKSGTDQAAGKKSDDQKNGQKQTGEKGDQGNKPDNKQSDPNKSGEKATGENKSDDKNSGDKNANQKDSAQNKNGTGKSDKNQSGGKSDDKKNNDKAGGGKQGGKSSSDQNKGDENAQGDKPSGENQSGDKNSGQKGNGKKESGANKSDMNQPPGDKADEKNSGDKSTGENPAGEKNADANKNSDNAQGKKTSDKNAGDKNSAQKGTAQKDKNDADKSGQNAQAGDKSDDQKTGDKASEGNKSDQKPSDINKTGKGDSDKKNPGEKNSADKNSTEKNGGDRKPPTDNAGEKGADNQKSAEKSQDNSQPAGRDKLNDPQEKAGAGKPSSDKGPSPESQGENKANKNVKPGGDPSKSDDEKSDKAQSPGQSENKSDSQGENEGDKSGGGGKGGSQKANQAGKGSAGTHTPSDDNGGKASEEKGQGEIGNTPGKDAQSNKPDGTGEKRKSDSGQPSNDPGDGSKSSDENSQNGQPTQQSPDGGKGGDPSPNAPGGQASGNPTGGGKSNTGPNGPDAPAVETGGDEVNINYAQKQTDLALRHLEDEMSKDKSELLDKLGWTKEDAKRFLERWQQLRRDARTAGPKGDEAKKNLEDALKSLGLRPTTTKIRHGSTSRDRDRGLHDAGRSAPPADWAEQFQQYQRSMAEEKK